MPEGQDLDILSETAHAASDTEASMISLLRMFKIPPHTSGYRQLAVAIPLYAQDSNQCLSKEIYPTVARQLGFTSPAAVEHSIRNAISSAWRRRDPAVWDAYFPAGRKPPSNARFISVLAQLLK